ncbi:hypothetical protein [Bartonella sp. HY406]|uniref:hypothetical protein n=1 Tax=Bartonella sp. HY406 TaxID=2979331 RepID=UPI0021C7F565|nr:hypothetical protein [Bartonella sp. HY406]UXN04557.1 hypothetical protein N6B01_05975 [Bartonella sp. HY406]
MVIKKKKSVHKRLNVYPDKALGTIIVILMLVFAIGIWSIHDAPASTEIKNNGYSILIALCVLMFNVIFPFINFEPTQININESRASNFANLFMKFGEIMGGNKSKIEVMAAIKSMQCYINNDDEHIQQVIDIMKEYIVNHSDFSSGFDTENSKQKAIFAALNCLNDFGKKQNQKIDIDSLMLKGKRDVIDSYEFIGGVMII